MNTYQVHNPKEMGMAQQRSAELIGRAKGFLKTVELGAIQGMTIRVHPSMIFVVAWILFTWKAGRGGSLASVVFGMVLVGAIFASVLIHELAHGLMAKQYGIAIRDITLFPFGGVARIEHAPTRARTEATIALAGPLANLALATLIFPVLVVSGMLDGIRSAHDFRHYNAAAPGAVEFLYFLFLANVMLAVFNLLPAFPLDGGRILRATLSRWAGPQTATAIAAGTGIAIAAMMLVVAVATSEYLLPIIAIFIALTALAEYRTVTIEGSLQRLTVGQFAMWEHGGINPRKPLSLAVSEGPHDIVVTEDGMVIGMLRKEDADRAMKGGGLQRRIGELMDQNIVVVEASISIQDAHNLMREHNQWTLPITERGKYRGMFTIDRLVHVHRYVRNQRPEHRGFKVFAGSLGQAFRSLSR